MYCLKVPRQYCLHNIILQNNNNNAHAAQSYSDYVLNLYINFNDFI